MAASNCITKTLEFTFSPAQRTLSTDKSRESRPQQSITQCSSNNFQNLLVPLKWESSCILGWAVLVSMTNCFENRPKTGRFYAFFRFFFGSFFLIRLISFSAKRMKSLLYPNFFDSSKALMAFLYLHLLSNHCPSKM